MPMSMIAVLHYAWIVLLILLILVGAGRVGEVFFPAAISVLDRLTASHIHVIVRSVILILLLLLVVYTIIGFEDLTVGQWKTGHRTVAGDHASLFVPEASSLWTALLILLTLAGLVRVGEVFFPAAISVLDRLFKASEAFVQLAILVAVLLLLFCAIVGVDDLTRIAAGNDASQFDP